MAGKSVILENYSHGDRPRRGAPSCSISNSVLAIVDNWLERSGHLVIFADFHGVFIEILGEIGVTPYSGDMCGRNKLSSLRR